jgi:hypothetical protein
MGKSIRNENDFTIFMKCRPLKTFSVIHKGKPLPVVYHGKESGVEGFLGVVGLIDAYACANEMLDWNICLTFEALDCVYECISEVEAKVYATKALLDKLVWPKIKAATATANSNRRRKKPASPEAD